MDTTNQLNELRVQLEEIKKYMAKADKTSQQIEELKKKVKLIEDRLDDGNPLDLARDFTLPEIKNICIKAIAQGLSFYVAYLILGVVWERFFKDDKK